MTDALGHERGSVCASAMSGSVRLRFGDSSARPVQPLTTINTPAAASRLNTTRCQFQSVTDVTVSTDVTDVTVGKQVKSQ